ncbi:WXG100 family type VII secretion target, partial [Streptomyces sp. PA03-6a]|nr:WXG100 family type VII secretion target [Streptomyces sp. PA03-6a]
MPEEKTYDGDGFTRGDHGVYGDPDYAGSVDDYDTWDWVQIAASIQGGIGDGASIELNDRRMANADPVSLRDAAGHFKNVEIVLSAVSKNMRDNAEALAGSDGGPWKGAAADTFVDMVNFYSRSVNAAADVLTGGEMGNSVPQQLADNGVNLARAQGKTVDIIEWYRAQAIRMGVGWPLDQSPKAQLVADYMTRDMRAVLRSLAGEYQVNIDSVRSPEDIRNPDPKDGAGDLKDLGGGPNAGGLGGGPNVGGLGGGPASAKLDPFPGGGGGGGGGAGMPNIAAFDPGLGGVGPDGTPDLGSIGAGGLGDNSFDTPELEPFPGAGGLTGGGGDLTGGGTGGGSIPPLPLTPFPGKSFTPVPGKTGTGGGSGLPSGGLDLSEDPFNWGRAVEDFPGDTGIGGTDGVGNGLDTPAAFPGNIGTESGLPGHLESPGLGTGQGMGMGGMPMAPGMGAGGAPANAGAVEPSDASGLIEADAEPWTGDPAVAEEADGGAEAGGEGLGLPFDNDTEQAGQGMGMGMGGMPMAPGMGAGGASANAGAVEPSDASGLIEADAEPWTGDPAVAEEA